MKILISFLLLIMLFTLLSTSFTLATETGYRDRVQQTLTWADTIKSGNFMIAAAKIKNGNKVEEGIKLFEEQIKRGKNSPSGMFDIYQLMIGYLYAQDKMSQSLKNSVKKYLETGNFYRGDTENHLTMYYTGLYLAAQTFPDLSAEQWYTGKSSKENMLEAMGWFDEWMDLTTTIGQGEFDSPTYMPVFIAPMFGLFQHAKDPVLKQNALVMIHWLLADFAVEHLEGIYVGAHSRDYPERVIRPRHRSSDMVAWGWYLFGKGELRFHYTLLAAALSDFDLPEIIYNIGTDRSQPYIHTETKRVRHIIRLGDRKNPPVYKYTYLTKDYALGSMQGGILQPIQQHTWDVTYMTDNPYMRIFTVHPYIGEPDLGMFFPEEMKFAFDEVSRSHTYYGSEDKWSASSPFEQTFQHENALIVLYNIPQGEKFAHIDGFFPKDLISREVDESGWIFCQGGKTYIAYYPLQPYEWIEEEECFRLRSYKLKNGCVVEVAQAEEYPSFAAFKDQIRNNTLVHDTFERTLMVSYTTSAGDVMTFTFDGARRLNGKLIDFAEYKLFRGPFLNAEVGSRKLEIKYKNKGMILDMATQQKGQILPLCECHKIAHDFALTGKLDHAAWDKAVPIQLGDAITGKPGRFATEVKLAYSDKYLYVGFQCQDDYTWGTVTARDGAIYDEECVEVFLNPAGILHQYYEINLSPKNIIYDTNVLNSRTPQNEYGKFLAQPTWNLEDLHTAVFVDGKMDEKGKGKSWTAEYVLPFDEIFGAQNIPPQPGDTWRVNFYRIDSPQKSQREHYAWSKTERAAFHLPWRFGYLRFGE
ncbi:MAG: hypothetical protein JSW07_15360 [bacterium]|nr:MAG: hypothetical protein JSW07_15360 [bacterium]